MIDTLKRLIFPHQRRPWKTDRRGAFRFGAARGCCNCTPAGCKFFEDTFTRPDSTNVGAQYMELSGAWAIQGWKLRAVSGGTLLSAVEHPEGQPDIRVETTVIMESAESVAARIVLDYIDADNHWYAEFKPGEGLRIVQVAGGSAAVRASMLPQHDAVPAGGNMCASIQGTRLTARIGAGGQARDLAAIAEGAFSSPRWGLGAEGSDVYFRATTATRTGGISHCADCNGPCDYCLDETGPRQFKVVIPDGTFQFFNAGARPGCMESECPSGDGTFYLDRVLCAWYGYLGFSYFSGVCSPPIDLLPGWPIFYQRGCVWGACAAVDCAEEGHSVLRVLVLLVADDRVLLQITNGNATFDGSVCSSGSVPYEAWYQHEFSSYPRDCNFQNLELVCKDGWTGHGVYLGNVSELPPNDGWSGRERCMPSAMARPLVSAVQ